MAEKDSMIAMAKYLLERPFNLILMSSKEHNNPVALMMMCIVDYYMERKGLYARMAQTPEILSKLLQFHSYASFRYYEYRSKYLKHYNGDKLLRCSLCHLVGNYEHILTHMAINHNEHVGITKCAYCKRKDVKLHINDKKFDRYELFRKCSDKYVQKWKIVKDDKELKIVTDFYDMLKEVAQKIDACTSRTHLFEGKKTMSTQKIDLEKIRREFERTECGSLIFSFGDINTFCSVNQGSSSLENQPATTSTSASTSASTSDGNSSTFVKQQINDIIDINDENDETETNNSVVSFFFTELSLSLSLRLFTTSFVKDTINKIIFTT